MLSDKIYKLTKELNNIFTDSEIHIKKLLSEKNIKTRHKNLSFLDALKYKFLCVYNNETQREVVANLNFNNHKANKNNYYHKEQKIPIEYYKHILVKVKQLFNSYSNNNLARNVIAVDGTYCNTNFKNDKTLETTLNMGFYDVSNCIPIDVVLKNHNDKNKEIEGLIDYISKCDIDLQKVIFVMDRAYFSYDLFNLLNERNIKFVIRIKNNCEYLNKNTKKKNKRNLNNIRFITYSAQIKETKKDKNNNNVEMIRTLQCHLATNLENIYDDENIKNIYVSRWNIEVFFKLIKKNFKFANLTEHNKKTNECYCKSYIVILINCILERLFELIIGEPNSTNNKYKVKYNKSLAINGIKKIILEIITSSLTISQLTNYFKNYFEIIYVEKNKNNPRVSKRPFTKWYVKNYSDFYKYAKIIDCIKNDTREKLNKNLKTEALTIQLVE